MRAKITACRLMVLEAAGRMDALGNKDPDTRQLLSLVKAFVPKQVMEVVDTCMQMHGAKGFSQDTPVWNAWAVARWVRMADGPDEVHWRTAARLELRRQKRSPLAGIGEYEPDRTAVFRRSTDTVSPETKARLADYSRL
jgi:alkylation response protein AidB-like acyl-CoA dehydrogenase